MSALRTVVTLLLCHIATSMNDILAPTTTEDSCLSNFLGEIIKDDDFLVIIPASHYHVDNMSNDIIWQLSKEKTKFVLNNDAKLENANWQISKMPGAVLLFACSMADIVNGVSSVRGMNVWGSAMKLIVAYSGRKRTMLEDAFFKEIFQEFAHLHSNIQVVYEFGDEAAMVPHKCMSCGRVDLVAESVCGVHKILDNSEIECTIRAAVLADEPSSFYTKISRSAKDIEIVLWKELARWSHFNLELEAIDAPKLKEKSYDVIIGAPYQMKDTTTKTIDFEYDDLTWCVERAGLHAPWRGFFLIMTWQVWLIGGVATYATAGTLYAFYQFYHHPQNYHYCSGLVLLAMFSIPVPYNPTHGIARIHFGLLLLYGLLIVILFNSFLSSILTQPRSQYQIHTTEELMNQNFRILIDEELMALHQLGDDDISSYVKHNYELCNIMIDCFSQLLTRSDVAAIVPRKFAEYFQFQSNSPIFCFDRSETFKRVSRSLTLSVTNSNLLNRTNSFIRQAMETGHLLKWGSTSAGRRTYENNRDRPVVFTMEHISGAMVIYVAGMGLAILAMIGECLSFENIRKGNGGGKIWKLMDRYFFCPDRIFWRKKSSTRHGVLSTGTEPSNHENP